MAENSISSNFMMLSEHLYAIFVHYIINGRTRAPPETELLEMLQTFQFGAKTDRRALQSKFKSWAKRMNFENGCLILMNSGKIIIPKEKCDELIMYLHSNEHSSVEKVIAQIRTKYSWTKKNFGMDRDVIVESIARNCTSEDCLKLLRLEMAKLSGTFCPSIQNTQYPDMAFRIPSAIRYIPPLNYRWPLPFPIGHMFTPNAFPIQYPFINNVYNMRNVPTIYGPPMATSMVNRKHENSTDDQGKHLKRANVSSLQNTKLIPNHNNSGNEIKPFKKPKNIDEYKALMEAVQLNPNLFPSVLKSEKTRFLFNLGIAPKTICSSTTLKRFRLELRKKMLMNRECMIYRERKLLRDRNKLKKCSHGKPRHFYLGIDSRTNLNSIRPGKSKSETMGRDRDVLKLSRKLNVEQHEVEEGNQLVKKAKITHSIKKESIEIIDISVSDDEFKENDFSSKKENDKTCGEIVIKSEVTEDGEFSKASRDNLPSVLRSTENNTTTKNDTFPEDEVADKIESSSAGNTQMLSFPSEEGDQRRDTGHQPMKAILMPKIVYQEHGEMKTCPPNVPFQIRRFPVPQILGSFAGHSNMNAAPLPHYIFPHATAVPTSVSQNVPTFSQPRLNFMVPGQNNSTRIVYPIHLSQSKNAKLLIVDKERKVPIFIIPSYQRPILPRNPSMSNATMALNSESKESKALSDITSRLNQQPMAEEATVTERQDNSVEGFFKSCEKDKVDIDKEMMRISNWIYRMRACVNPCMFKYGLENSVEKLITQLDVGIYLVREAKKSLAEVEKLEDVPKISEAIK